ncbi:MAG: tRNA epoxyqueuosine(34) reductase QueG [Steroidobacteraceae bacterium]
MTTPLTREDLLQLAQAEGFADIGVTGVDLPEDETWLQQWLSRGMHGQMGYMARHGTMRSRPQELQPGALRVISLRMDYWPPEGADATAVLNDPSLGYLSRYALGRDYHKVMRAALARLAAAIAARMPHEYRVFVDSAPVLEKALARNAGLGWIGKHTNLIARDAGSYFFLGEILTDLPLAMDTPATAHCGSCSACMPACPTQAIVAPHQLDARRCISYLTIEMRGTIPLEFRAAIGNRIYGCDDCQLVCPWNKFAQTASHPDFKIRHGLDAPRLTDLIAWTREEFESRFEGSAVRRIGHEAFIRNVAVALGNRPGDADAIEALRIRSTDASEVIAEHARWALDQLAGKPAALLPASHDLR